MKKEVSLNLARIEELVKGYRVERKGISNLIAAVLLIAFVLSVAVLFSDFLPNLVGGLTTSTSNQSNKIVAAQDFKIEILGAEYNSIQDDVDLTLQNMGKDVDGQVVATVYCKSGNGKQKKFTGLPRGRMKSVTVDVGSCDPEKISVDLESYPVSVNTDQIDRLDVATWAQRTPTEFESVAIDSSNVFYNPLVLSQLETTSSESSTFSGSKTNLTVSGGGLQLVS